MVLAAAIRLSEEAGEAHANTIPGEPVWYGLAGFAALLVLLWITTRFNAER